MEVFLFLLGNLLPAILNFLLFRTETVFGGEHMTVLLDRWVVRCGKKFYPFVPYNDWKAYNKKLRNEAKAKS